jgi:hypothetical protein
MRKQHHPTDNMEHRGKKSGGGRKNAASASGKKSNTKAKQGSQRGGRAGYPTSPHVYLYLNIKRPF